MKLLLTILVVMLLALQYRLWVGQGSIAEVWQLEQALERQRVENDGLEARNRRLAAEVSDLKHGLAAIEERARTEFGMIKRGETYFQMVDR